METIDNALSTVFKNRYSSTLITLFLVLYSGLVAPKLPKLIVKFFENPIFRILILSLIVYNGNKDPQFSIMIAVGFTVTMNMVSKQKLFEGMDSMDNNSLNRRQTLRRCIRTCMTNDKNYVEVDDEVDDEVDINNQNDTVVSTDTPIATPVSTDGASDIMDETTTGV